jgi:D-glycero-alpha-D-manno-heptose 1-phosphate guanylyltransferase
MTNDARGATAIVLAGGRGTRISHLHPDLPKPMIPCRGLPFLEWVLRHFRHLGLTRFVVSLGHLADVAEAYLRTRPSDGLSVRTVREPGPFGTGGGLRYAWQHTDPGADVVVTNGDSLVLGDLRPAWDVFARPEVDGVLIGLPREDAARYGTLGADSDGRLRAFEEKKPGPGVISAGIYFLKGRMLPLMPPETPLSIETGVFPRWLAEGRDLRVHPCPAPFLDIGTPESLEEADGFLRRNWPWEDIA